MLSRSITSYVSLRGFLFTQKMGFSQCIYWVFTIGISLRGLIRGIKLNSKLNLLLLLINLKIGLVIIKIKGKEIIINFNILLLGNNKAVLGMP